MVARYSDIYPRGNQVCPAINNRFDNSEIIGIILAVFQPIAAFESTPLARGF